MGNVILVHGAWADGSSWSDVIGLLQAAGHRVIATQHPTTSLAADVAAVREAMRSLEGPKVLAGHSYGGTVITAAASGADDVTGLVFVAALPVDEGESVADHAEPYPEMPLAAIQRQDADGYVTLDLDRYPDVFANGVDEARARVLAAVQQPLALACFTTALDVRPAWRDLPSWYVLATEDRAVHPDEQRAYAERAGATVSEVPTGHAAPVSEPRAVADAVLAALAHAGEG